MQLEMKSKHQRNENLISGKLKPNHGVGICKGRVTLWGQGLSSFAMLRKYRKEVR